MIYVLNIGLAREAKSNIGTGTALRALMDLERMSANDELIDYSIQQSETETTVVAIVDIRGNPEDVLTKVFRLSQILEQDCIAMYNLVTKEGALVGPRADKWGAFNPEFFLLPDGSKLSAPSPLRNAA